MILNIMAVDNEGKPLWDKPMQKTDWPSEDFMKGLGNSLQNTAKQQAYFEVTISGLMNCAQHLDLQNERHMRQLKRAGHHFPVIGKEVS